MHGITIITAVIGEVAKVDVIAPVQGISLGRGDKVSRPCVGVRQVEHLFMPVVT